MRLTGARDIRSEQFQKEANMSLNHTSAANNATDADLEVGGEMALEFILTGKVDEANEAETIMSVERTRYAHVVADLGELEVILAAQEAEASFAFMHTHDESAEAEEEYPFL